MQITNVVENVNNEHIFTLYKYYLFWHIKMFCSTIIWFYELLNFFFVIQYLQYNCIWNMILHVYIIETNTLFTVLINFGFEIRFNINTGLRSHLFRNKYVFNFVLPNIQTTSGWWFEIRFEQIWWVIVYLLLCYIWFYLVDTKTTNLLLVMNE